ncbi:MAG: twin-arginine translocase TatA/TatE family subunit [Candidatus Baltobacteraceae bacterium]
MLSLPDMAILGVLALLVFGEERLPKIVRQAGRAMREVQNTSQSFVREMERAADLNEPRPPVTPAPAPEELETIAGSEES